MTINVKKFASFEKNAKIRGVEILKKNSITIRNYTVIYCRTLEEIPWLLRLRKPKNPTNFPKTWKNASFIKKNR